MAEARAADRAHGPCRDLPPLLSAVSAEVQGGVGGKARAARRPESRPEAFAEPRLQERVKRHIVEHMIDVPCVQILDAPVPQMVDDVMDAIRRLDHPIAE